LSKKRDNYYKSTKRRKELERKRKKEEKRDKRRNRDTESAPEGTEEQLIEQDITDN
jgi:LAS superfamily LD-carboxypeptidase LdcB